MNLNGHWECPYGETMASICTSGPWETLVYVPPNGRSIRPFPSAASGVSQAGWLEPSQSVLFSPLPVWGKALFQKGKRGGHRPHLRLKTNPVVNKNQRGQPPDIPSRCRIPGTQIAKLWDIYLKLSRGKISSQVPQTPALDTVVRHSASKNILGECWL